MRTLRTVAELRTALAPGRAGGLSIGLVPTMGALHDGHLALLARAREECDLVVVSLFVNPSQFDERADLDRYPRDERRDAGLGGGSGCRRAVRAGRPGGVSRGLRHCGRGRRGDRAARGRKPRGGALPRRRHGRHEAALHDAPDVAYFGQKDAQQLLVIRRLVADLNLPVRIAAVPTVREADGLALSSRNLLLSPDQRRRALGDPAGADGGSRAGGGR